MGKIFGLILLVIGVIAGVGITLGVNGARAQSGNDDLLNSLDKAQAHWVSLGEELDYLRNQLEPTTAPESTPTPPPQDNEPEAPTPTPTQEPSEEGEWPQPVNELTLDDAPFGREIVTNLRTDLEEVKNAGNYYTRFKAAQYTENAEGNEYTSASFVLNFEPCEQGNHWLMCNRINVGLLATSDEVRWFVYSNPFRGEQHIECLRGTRMWEDEHGNAGCLGDAGDIVGLSMWYGVRFVKQGNGEWDIRVEDQNRKSYLVARLQPGGSEVAWVETIYQLSSPGSGVGGFWHDMPYFLGPTEEGTLKMRIWPASDPDGEWWQLNRAWVNEDEFSKTFDPGEGDYRPDPTFVQHAIKDEVEPGAHGSWYTGKKLSNDGDFVCWVTPLF